MNLDLLLLKKNVDGIGSLTWQMGESFGTEHMTVPFAANNLLQSLSLPYRRPNPKHLSAWQRGLPLARALSENVVVAPAKCCCT